MSRRLVVDHVARIEGHAGISVVINGSQVERVEFDVDEGIRLFEGLLRGRPVADVPALVSRICAICSHGHAITASDAIERALGVTVSSETRLLRDLAFQGSVIESHALHVFCLALPDFLGHAGIVTLASVDPATVGLALRLKKLGNTVQEAVGGRAVHPVNYVIGGFGRLPSLDELIAVRDALEAGRADCDEALAVLCRVPMPAFLHEPVRCAALVPDGEAPFFGRRVRLSDGTEMSVDDYRALTNERPVAHSHAKHSAHAGRSFMVGALARLTLNGDRLSGRAREAWTALGLEVPSANIVANSAAQFVELVHAVEHALALVSRLIRDGLTGPPAVEWTPRAGEATAASEVPRGTLFHHYRIDSGGFVTAADVVTPTAENYGNLEDMLRATVRDGIGESDDELTRRLQVVARAYDPCVSCSVHATRVNSQ